MKERLQETPQEPSESATIEAVEEFLAQASIRQVDPLTAQWVLKTREEVERFLAQAVIQKKIEDSKRKKDFWRRLFNR